MTIDTTIHSDSGSTQQMAKPFTLLTTLSGEPPLSERVMRVSRRVEKMYV